MGYPVDVAMMLVQPGPVYCLYGITSTDGDGEVALLVPAPGGVTVTALPVAILGLHDACAVPCSGLQIAGYTHVNSHFFLLQKWQLGRFLADFSGFHAVFHKSLPLSLALQ